jgi:UDP-N-acetylmuramoyl-L-alanyl-D-glutamate--2,6-diaminopimelate ligase
VDERLHRPHTVPIALSDLAAAVQGTLHEGGRESAERIPHLFVTGITHSSSEVIQGDVFAGLPGRRMHGASFASAAAGQGAVAVLTDEDGRVDAERSGLPVVVVSDARAVLGPASALIYGNPGERIALAGVTGTNGKTTVTAMLVAALTATGQATGAIGTLGVTFGGNHISGVRTTPEAPEIQSILALMLEEGIGSAVMEVSSIAVSERRIDGLVFDVMGFTNLTQDHLDYHHDMESYFAAKAQMFGPERSRCSVICVDDEWGHRLAAQAREASALQGYRVVTVSASGSPADWRITHQGMAAHITGPDDVTIEMRLPMPGAVNAANTAVALAMAVSLGLAPGPAAAAIGQVRVPGRCEIFEAPQAPLVIVDYAHTPDAISRMVQLAREAVTGRVVIVLGAGGDRDQSKRPLMGAAASMGDHVVVTDDNPRAEDPAAIRSAVIAGVTGPVDVEDIADRATAIRHAIASASERDVVLVLGKGHETGQQIGDHTLPFDDREIVRAALTEERK